MLIDTIAVTLSLSPRFITRLAATASHRYFYFTVPKANGGTRDIYHPAKDLKGIQRWLQAEIVSRFPVHSAAAAYRQGQNIANHAQRHLKSRYLLRVDFTQFFESIAAADITAYLADHASVLPAGWDATDTDVFTKLVCRQGRLTIGSITSPGLSNSLLYRFDEALTKLCHDLEVTYSRYADDMFFSTIKANVLRDVPSIVADLLKSLSYPTGLLINASKTRHSSLKRQRRITGLVLSAQGEVSLGRAFKRGMRTQIYKMDALGIPEQRRLAGLLSFVKDVEPHFFNRLVTKYGEKVSKVAQFKNTLP
jgi:RNA-directed DNA polymerase